MNHLFLDLPAASSSGDRSSYHEPLSPIPAPFDAAPAAAVRLSPDQK